MATADSYGLFWNSDDGDRKYSADSFEKWLKKFFTSGVFEGDLQVLAYTGMTVQVATGYSNVNGKVGLFETANNITLSPANSQYPRIDTIVIERNDTDRAITVKAVTGSYSGDNPQPTAPVWNETSGIYQLVLAQIYIGVGVSEITQANITDTRTNTNLCGYIAGTVTEMDFSQFAAQFETYFEEFEAGNEAAFDDWFDEMKDQLSTDAAGHLQMEIDVINSALNGKADTSSLATVATSGSYNDLSNKPTIPSATSIGWTGTASASAVRYERVGIGSTYTEINGTKYMEASSYTTSGDERYFSFTNNAITSTAVYDVYCDVPLVSPTQMVLSGTNMKVYFNSSDNVTKCRLYIR